VAAAFGSQYAPSGFELQVNTLLPPGGYTLKVFARSTVTGTFNNVRQVPVTIKTITQLTVEKPLDGGSVSVPFEVRGWAVNNGDPGGVGVDAVHVHAFPNAGGDPVFLGSAELGLTRTDVATLLNNPQFEPSGFSLNVTTPLADGTYTLKVFARDTVSGAFATTRQMTINVGPDPHMFVDSPTQGATVSASSFEVRGWAVDLAAPTGTGVDAVHVYAFPAGGGSPVFLGGATLGFIRAGVGALYGAQFEPSGFSLDATGLAPGSYTLRVFARSTVSGTFNKVRVISVTAIP
jgi:hypothetical protein